MDAPNIFNPQLLGFRYFIDFEDTDGFLKSPISDYGNLVENLFSILER